MFIACSKTTKYVKAGGLALEPGSLDSGMSLCKTLDKGSLLAVGKNSILINMIKCIVGFEFYMQPVLSVCGFHMCRFKAFSATDTVNQGSKIHGFKKNYLY